MKDQPCAVVGATPNHAGDPVVVVLPCFRAPSVALELGGKSPHVAFADADRLKAAFDPGNILDPEVVLTVA